MVKAQELKRYFSVYGYFYNRIIGGKEYQFRELLDIVLVNARVTSPDLIVVMMNPGSSRPADPSYRPLTLEYFDIHQYRELIPTIPDNAQYQIMRYMLICRYQNARVVNLSDLREAKSGVFEQIWPTLDDEHSLFSYSRFEFSWPLFEGVDDVLLAWGLNKRNGDLAKQALKRLKPLDKNLIGLKKGDYGYSYPSPLLQAKKEEWLSAMQENYCRRNAS